MNKVVEAIPLTLGEQIAHINSIHSFYKKFFDDLCDKIRDKIRESYANKTNFHCTYTNNNELNTDLWFTYVDRFNHDLAPMQVFIKKCNKKYDDKTKVYYYAKYTVISIANMTPQELNKLYRPKSWWCSIY